MRPEQQQPSTRVVAVVMPVRNRKEITKRCLAHLQQLGILEDSAVYVVDDGSTDGTARMIRDTFPSVHVLEGSGLLWWAGAIREGMQRAVDDGAHCVCWLNDDCLPDADSLELLTATALNDGVVCGGVCWSPDGQEMLYSGGMIQGAWPQRLRSWPESCSEVFDVHWLNGNMVAIPSLVWERIGFPDPRFMRHNMADVAYTHAAFQAGIAVRLLHSASAVVETDPGRSRFSWADPDLNCRQLIASLSDPAVWWYAPGLVHFLWSLFRWRGVPRLLRLTAKFLAVLTLKLFLPGSWVLALQQRMKKRRSMALP